MAKSTDYGTKSDKGLVSSMGEYGKESGAIKMVTADQNMAVMERLVKDWKLGPTKATEDPAANKVFWTGFGVAMKNISEAEARRLTCGNCEYFDNTPEMQKAMEAIPMNKYDLDGGGRGFCNRFDFICHNLRVCQGWEKKNYYLPD